MSFKKLDQDALEFMGRDGITEILEHQKLAWRKIREGKNLLILDEEQKGKSILLSITTILRVPQPEEGSPRAVIVCKDDQSSLDFCDRIRTWSRRMDLTIDLAHEKGNQLQQRNDIFDGTEIIVGTPKRLYDLYIQNGINLKLLKLFAIDDAHETLRGNNPGYMIRMAESLPNCQFLMCAQKQTEKIDYFINATEFGFQKVKLG